MSLPVSQSPTPTDVADLDDLYLPAEEVARRLGISAAILIRRVEAGDIPARRVQGPDGPRYEVLPSDLGLDPSDIGARSLPSLHAPGTARLPSTAAPLPSPAPPADPRAADPPAPADPRLAADGLHRGGHQPAPPPPPTPSRLRPAGLPPAARTSEPGFSTPPPAPDRSAPARPVRSDISGVAPVPSMGPPLPVTQPKELSSNRPRPEPVPPTSVPRRTEAPAPSARTTETPRAERPASQPDPRFAKDPSPGAAPRPAAEVDPRYGSDAAPPANGSGPRTGAFTPELGPRPLHPPPGAKPAGTPGLEPRPQLPTRPELPSRPQPLANPERRVDPVTRPAAATSAARSSPPAPPRGEPRPARVEPRPARPVPGASPPVARANPVPPARVPPRASSPPVAPRVEPVSRSEPDVPSRWAVAPARSRQAPEVNGRATSAADISRDPAALTPATRDVSVVPRPEPLGLSDLTLDPRDLVGSLLDRWQASVEQRIHAEQIQRVDAELADRDSLIRELRREVERLRSEHAATVQAMRLEHTASLSDRDRAIAQRDRALADCENQIISLRELATRRRGLFSRR